MIINLCKIPLRTKYIHIYVRSRTSASLRLNRFQIDIDLWSYLQKTYIWSIPHTPNLQLMIDGRRRIYIHISYICWALNLILRLMRRRVICVPGGWSLRYYWCAYGWAFALATGETRRTHNICSVRNQVWVARDLLTYIKTVGTIVLFWLSV